MWKIYVKEQGYVGIGLGDNKRGKSYPQCKWIIYTKKRIYLWINKL